MTYFFISLLLFTYKFYRLSHKRADDRLLESLIFGVAWPIPLFMLIVGSTVLFAIMVVNIMFDFLEGNV